MPGRVLRRLGHAGDALAVDQLIAMSARDVSIMIAVAIVLSAMRAATAARRVVPAPGDRPGDQVPGLARSSRSVSVAAAAASTTWFAT